MTDREKIRNEMKESIDSMKQLVLCMESDGKACIKWDTKSIDTAIALLEDGISYLKKQKQPFYIQEGRFYRYIGDSPFFTKGEVYPCKKDNYIRNNEGEETPWITPEIDKYWKPVEEPVSETNRVNAEITMVKIEERFKDKKDD